MYGFCFRLGGNQTLKEFRHTMGLVILQAADSHSKMQLTGSGDRSERIRTYNFPQVTVICIESNHGKWEPLGAAINAKPLGARTNPKIARTRAERSMPQDSKMHTLLQINFLPSPILCCDAHPSLRRVYISWESSIQQSLVLETLT